MKKIVSIIAAASIALFSQSIISYQTNKLSSILFDNEIIDFHNKAVPTINWSIALPWLKATDYAYINDFFNINQGGGSLTAYFLREAIWDKRMDIVDFLLEHGADANIDQSGPLFMAIGKGDIKLIRLLLQYGAKINIVGKWNWTPLNRALEEKNIDIIRLLLEQGANPNFGKHMPLLAACSKSVWARPDDKNELLRIQKTIHLLLKYGANINAQDEQGNTTLNVICEESRSGSIPEGQNRVRILLDNGANVNMPNNEGQTPLHWAVYNGNTSMAKLLLGYGADIHSKNIGGYTPLDFAHTGNDKDMIQLLENSQSWSHALKVKYQLLKVRLKTLLF